VVGLGLEVAGAAFLAWEAMTTRRGTFPSAATAEEQRPRSRAIVGFGLLALGVVVQLAGYASPMPGCSRSPQARSAWA